MTSHAKPILIPDPIREALEDGAALVVSVSGGKDGQAMLKRCVEAHRQFGWKGELVALHADLGRAEWNETPAHVEWQCRQLGIPLEIVSRKKGDLVDRWQERMVQVQGRGIPFWSSSASRYCTSDLKRGPIDIFLRRFSHVVSAEGVRAEESPNRAKKPVCALREKICTRERVAWDWRPLHHYCIDDVWDSWGTNRLDLEIRRALYQSGQEERALKGWPFHPAYVYGNERLSCALCVLANKNDLANGARHHPELLQILIGMERESGFTFKKDFSLEELLPAAA